VSEAFFSAKEFLSIITDDAGEMISRSYSRHGWDSLADVA